MAESAQNPVEMRINEHLEAIDKALADKGVPLTERRSVTADVEAQIRDMLAVGVVGNPTSSDIEAVLRKLDAPESYAEDAEVAHVEQQPLVEPAAPPRVARTAIVGAVWAPLFFIFLLLWFWHMRPLALAPGQLPPRPSALQIMTWFTVIPLGLCAPFGATILGWLAASQIRRSSGRRYGMGIALATGLFYPLLALDALITISIWLPVAAIVTWFFPDINALPLKYPFIAFDVVSAVAVCVFVDYRIVRWVLRKVNVIRNDAMTGTGG